MSRPVKCHDDVICPDCGAKMILRESRFGLFYGCMAYPDCKGSHGAHPDGSPLGVPADKETKELRILAHAALDRLWKPSGSKLTRDEAYLKMQSIMGLNSEQAHIGMFTAGQCRILISKLGGEK